MGRFKTNARKKLRKALTRVNKVVIMEIRKQLDQQRKWKAEVIKRTSSAKKSIEAEANK
jgi:hypothetical protein